MGTADVENAKAGRLEHDVRRLGGAAAEEVVTAVGHDIQVDRLGQHVPFAVPVREFGRALVLRGNDISASIPVRYYLFSMMCCTEFRKGSEWCFWCGPG